MSMNLNKAVSDVAVKAKCTADYFSCKYCNKQFKKGVVRDKHEYEQVCIANGRKTYCKVCSWTAENIQLYNEHLISRGHLDKVGRLTVTGLDMIIVNPVQDKMVTMFACDPVLAQCGNPDVVCVSGMNMKVFHTDGSMTRAEHSNVDSSLHELSLSDVDKAVRDTEVANAGIIKYQALVERERGLAKMTVRQMKILEYLARFQNDGVTEMVARLKVILDKIGMDDADFLGTHIRNYDGLSISAKQVYGSYMEKFINALTRRVMDGEKLYRDMDIFEFVAKLTK
jgi:hypothetical protein